MNKTATMSSDLETNRYLALKEKQKLSRVFEMPDLACPNELVCDAEIEFFMHNGFLIKPRLLSADKIEAGVRRVWTHLVKAVPLVDGARPLDPRNPDTWASPQWVKQPPHPHTGPFQGRQPIEHYGRIVKLHDLGRADYLLDLFANDADVRSIARRMLGPNLKPSTHTRGVYLVFPKQVDNATNQFRLPRLPKGSTLGPHSDQVCQQLNACAYLEDVPARSGGFTVYPGSHKNLFGAHEFEANWSPTDNYLDTVETVVSSVEPLELIAPAGSVIFWHGRLLHSVGIHLGSSIRWALFADFTQNRESLNAREHRLAGQYEWFKDAQLFRDDHRVSKDMWRSWNIG